MFRYLSYIVLFLFYQVSSLNIPTAKQKRGFKIMCTIKLNYMSYISQPAINLYYAIITLLTKKDRNNKQKHFGKNKKDDD